jgi:23S rRNA pseudouridine1911/1915/1917 synthase
MPELKQCIIPLEHRGWRLDRSLSDLFSEYSRARIQAWIKSGAVQIERQACKPSLIVSGGEQVRLQIEPEPLTFMQP